MDTIAQGRAGLETLVQGGKPRVLRFWGEGCVGEGSTEDASSDIY